MAPMGTKVICFFLFRMINDNSMCTIQGLYFYLGVYGKLHFIPENESWYEYSKFRAKITNENLFIVL